MRSGPGLHPAGALAATDGATLGTGATVGAAAGLSTQLVQAFGCAVAVGTGRGCAANVAAAPPHAVRARRTISGTNLQIGRVIARII